MLLSFLIFFSLILLFLAASLPVFQSYVEVESSPFLFSCAAEVHGVLSLGIYLMRNYDKREMIISFASKVDCCKNHMEHSLDSLLLKKKTENLSQLSWNTMQPLWERSPLYLSYMGK